MDRILDTPDEGVILDLDPQALSQMASLMADTLIKNVSTIPYSSIKMDYSMPIQASALEVTIPKMTSEEAVKILSLDLVSSATAGALDILGQIRDFFVSIFNSVSTWIVSGVQTFIQQYVLPAIGAITSGITSFINTTVLPAISGVIGQISGFITSYVLPAISGVSGAIMNFITGTVIPTLTGWFNAYVVTPLTTVSNFITGTVIPTLTSIPDRVMGFINNTVIPTLAGIPSVITGAVGNIIHAFSSMLQTVSTGLTVTLPTAIANLVLPAVSDIGRLVTSGISTLISTAIGGLSSTVQGFISSVTSGINSIVSNVTAGFQSVANIFTGFVNAIANFPNWFPSWFMESIAKPIGDALSQLGNWIWNALPEWLKNIVTGIGDFFTKTLPEGWNAFVNGVKAFLADPLKWLQDNLVKPFMSGLEALGNWIWNALPEWLKNIVTGIGDFFTKTLPEGWNAFVNGVKAFLADPLKWLDKNLVQPLMTGFKSIGDWIWNALPDWLKGGLTALGDFFKGIGEGFINFIKDPWGTLQSIGAKVWEGLQWVGAKVWEGLQSFGNMFMQGIQGLWNLFIGGLKGLVNPIIGVGADMMRSLSELITGQFHEIWYSIANIFIGFTYGAVDFAKKAPVKLGEVIAGLFKDVIEPTRKAIMGMMEKPLEESLKKLVEGKTPAGQLTELWDMFSTFQLTLLTGHALSVAEWFCLHAIATPLERFKIVTPVKIRIKGKAKAHPVGVGGEAGGEGEAGMLVPLVIRPAWLFRELASEIRSYGKDITRALISGLGIWLSRPFVRYANAVFRNTMPVELPDMNLILESLRRYMAHDDFEKVLEKNRGFLRLYGYNDDVIDYLTSDKLTIKVKDRFRVDRTVPLSLMYELPSASDVATMMVRDIFYDLEEFKKLYEARGMHEDIGALYYMLRFRYPPPEKLWQFTTRGISGLLWARIPSEEKKRIAEEGGKIGAFEPSDAVAFNASDPAKRSKLLEAYSTYMKWHDYARFSWIEGFTSDNQIMTDVQADIPTKIDLRWMTRFGIFEHMSMRGVSLESPINEIRARVLEDTEKSKIVMDLTQFSRFIQATGLHPDLVPIVAVAETINAIADERTLLRTATLNLFKEGFWNTDSIEALLEGAITATFKVAFFDMQALKWDTKNINIPLMFLPPERKLTELRALADRAMDILREIQRDISTAYQEYILVSYDEYKKTLSNVVERVNKVFEEDFYKITGTRLPEELKLKFVEEYYKPYVEALDTFRSVHIIRRLRAWTQRWLGWIMYRVATGVASLQDTEELIKVTAERAMLTTREVEFLQDVMKIMYRIASREYIPTPSQLLTMSEYVSIPDELVDRVFQARYMSQEWADIWKRYISIRTMADDVKALISSYLYVTRYVKVPESIANTVMAYASQIGFGAEEMNILRLRTELEELLRNSRENVREYIPTPSMLASMAEYLPEVRNYYDDVVRAKGIPEAWQPLWARYIDLKPLIDEVKTYFTRAEQLYARFMIPEEEFMKVLNQVKDYLGYTDKEIEFILLTSRYERHRTAWTELIGDVDRMVMLAEYSPRARDFALGTLYKMIDALPIEPDTKNVLKEMWEQFIRVKPVIEEVKRYVTDLINLYVDGGLSDQAFSQELEALKEWGLDDYEIMFYKAMASMRRAKKLKIYLG